MLTGAGVLAGLVLAVLALGNRQQQMEGSAPAVSPSPGSTGPEPDFAERCQDTDYASDIQIHRFMYLDCGMARKVAEKWALGEGLPGIAGADTIPWECRPASTGSGPFADLPTAGYVICRGYRGEESIRFNHRKPEN